MTALLRVSVYVTTFWCVLADWKADNCSGDRIHFGTTLKFGLPPYNYQIQFDHDQVLAKHVLLQVQAHVIFVSSDSHSGVLPLLPIATRR